MIRYTINNNINLKKWDRCIQNSINSNFYAKSWYLNIICENWDALILNDYEAVMPIPYKKKLGIKYIYQPFFCQQLGLFSKNINLRVDRFINSIPKDFEFIGDLTSTLLRVKTERSFKCGHKYFSFQSHCNQLIKDFISPTGLVTNSS